MPFVSWNLFQSCFLQFLVWNPIDLETASKLKPRFPPELGNLLLISLFAMPMELSIYNDHVLWMGYYFTMLC